MNGNNANTVTFNSKTENTITWTLTNSDTQESADMFIAIYGQTAPPSADYTGFSIIAEYTNVSPLGTRTYTATNLSPNTTYFLKYYTRSNSRDSELDGSNGVVLKSAVTVSAGVTTDKAVTTQPTISNISPGGNGVTFTVTKPALESSVDLYVEVFRGSTRVFFNTVTNVTSSQGYNVTGLLEFTDHVIYAQATATDKLQSNAATANFKTLDITAPSISGPNSITYSPNNGSYNLIQNQFTFSDSGSGINTSTISTTGNVNFSSEGNYTATVSVRDNANNLASKNVSIFIVIPSYTITWLPNGGT
jgi:hypothetical protein